MVTRYGFEDDEDRSKRKQAQEKQLEIEKSRREKIERDLRQQASKLDSTIRDILIDFLDSRYTAASSYGHVKNEVRYVDPHGESLSAVWDGIRILQTVSEESRFWSKVFRPKPSQKEERIFSLSLCCSEKGGEYWLVLRSDRRNEVEPLRAALERGIGLRCSSDGLSYSKRDT